jgi:UDP-3-O-[3-hydroxymyristoyl] glucosamine N-acyltransferase
MKFKASQIAMMLQGQLEGADVEVSQLCKIEEGKTGSLTFLSNPKYTPFIYQTLASVAIVSHDFAPEEPLPNTLSLIRVGDAYGAFAQLLEAYNQFMLPQPGISGHAVIASSAKIGVNVHIGDFVCIGEGVVIEDNVIVQSNVNIGNRVAIGAGSVLYPGVRVYHDCVIGSDGFGFAPDANGVFKKVPQIGNVVLEDNVDVGANTCIDRATMGSTIIRKGVKLDNLIQIAHNVEIGENTVMAAQCGVAGSTKIGKQCMIGGQVGFAGHITVADETKIAAQSGISGNVKVPGTTLMGTPAFSAMEYNKSYVFFKRLPGMNQMMDQFKKWMESQSK